MGKATTPHGSTHPHRSREIAEVLARHGLGYLIEFATLCGAGRRNERVAGCVGRASSQPGSSRRNAAYRRLGRGVRFKRMPSTKTAAATVRA